MVSMGSGVSGHVCALCGLPDHRRLGRRVVSGSMGKTLQVWDVDTGRCTATLKGHTSNVRALCVLPDGRRMVSGSTDKTLRVWELETLACVATLSEPDVGTSTHAVPGKLGRHQLPATCVAALPDGLCRGLGTGCSGCGT